MYIMYGELALQNEYYLLFEGNFFQIKYLDSNL